jgi:hypothetical protein
VRLCLPLGASHIEQAVSAFREQSYASCYLYIKGHVTIGTGELCVIPEWLPVARPDPELDLLTLGNPEIPQEDETLVWVAPTRACFLLLSTTPLS